MEKTKQSWWRKKWWWAAAVLWLLLAYPASIGPVAYVAGRGWLNFNLVAWLYRPVLPDQILHKGGGPRHVLGRYYLRCYYAGDAADGVYPMHY